MPKLAGKAIRCTKCGQTFRPEAPAGALSPAPAVTAAGYVMPTRRTAEMAADLKETGPVRDWIVPGALLALAILLRLVDAYTVGNRPEAGFGSALGLAAAEGFVAALAVVLAGLGMTYAFGFDYGDPGPALLKLATTAFFMCGLINFFNLTFNVDPRTAWGLIMAVYLLMMGHFFTFAALCKMDLVEALASGAGATIVQTIVLMSLATKAGGPAMAVLVFGSN